MKNNISKILNFIALFIRIAVYIVATVGIVIFVMISYQLIAQTLPELFGILVLVSIVMGIYALIAWAFLRKKIDTFECPNRYRSANINCGKPYACDTCPYNEEKR